MRVQPLVLPPMERARTHQPQNPVLYWNPMVHRQYQRQPLGRYRLYSPLLPPRSGASMPKLDRRTKGQVLDHPGQKQNTGEISAERDEAMVKCIADWTRELVERPRPLWKGMIRTNRPSNRPSILGDSATLTALFSSGAYTP